MTDAPLHATISLRGVILAESGEVLAVRRASDGGWELPGGRLGAREDPVAALRREIDEETGLDAAVEEPLHTVSWRNDADNGRFAVYYQCTARKREISLSDEHTAAEWLSPDEVARWLSDPQTRAVRRATASISTQ